MDSKRLGHATMRFGRRLFAATERGIGFVKSNAEHWYHVVVTAGTIVAGIWALWIFVFERTAESALSIDPSVVIVTNAPSLGMRRLVFLDVALANKGKRMIKAMRVTSNAWASPKEDKLEQLRYSCGAEIRRIDASAITNNKAFDWFTDAGKALTCPDGTPTEINLLREYELSKPPNVGVSDFWMEPGEQYHLGTAFILTPGDYLVKVHFYGKTEKDFWSRVIFFQVD
jgi:hypothetical protein